ncbi:hypothetical protein [Mycobacterium sp. ST-F2]|uniref:hypothetical protein n=1 Tax=Mycobacterium sp. ST-F2 TaxID=1490484 RepID=UPI00115061BF|nr:hypothetical protein [Mycobacterium sp. ST-F2]
MPDDRSTPGATHVGADSPDARVFADALSAELIPLAPPAWIHIRAEIDPSGRGEAFAVTAQGSHWLQIPDRATALVRGFRPPSEPWARLRIDIDPGVPAVLDLDSRKPPQRARALLIAFSAVCLTAAAVISLVAVFRSPPQIPVEVAPPVSDAQAEAEQLVRGWYDNEKSADPAFLRQLVCSAPNGIVALELANAESGSFRDAKVRIEGFTDFVDNGGTAQIKVYYTGHALSAAAAQQIESRKEGYFIWTFVFTRENGQLKLCGG